VERSELGTLMAAKGTAVTSARCEHCGATENVEHSEQLGKTLCGKHFAAWTEMLARGATAIAPGDLPARTLPSRNGHDVEPDSAPAGDSVRIIPVSDFAAVEEPGADPLVGADGEAVIPRGGDAMLYGDGGASKTTLSIDLAFHLAAGDDWLGIPVPGPASVVLVEAEGPRALFRRKLRRKLDSWTGSEVGGRLRVLETPWADFRFPDAEEVADLVGEYEVDVLVAGPLTRVGMDELGTLQQVRDFMGEVARFRERAARRLTVLLIHHENKGGTVSGAWEGAGDTLLHATVHARGKTSLVFQKTRWSGEWHKQKLELDWTDGEGFAVAEGTERDLIAEITEWLSANPHSTAKEIATKKEVKRPDGTIECVIPGIGANETRVRELLAERQDIFRERTGDDAKAVGRHPSAHVWEHREGAPEDPAHLGASAPRGVGGNAGALVRSPLGSAPATSAPTPTSQDALNPSADLGAPGIGGEGSNGSPDDADQMLSMEGAPRMVSADAVLGEEE
jgi:hypothetical protein